MKKKLVILLLLIGILTSIGIAVAVGGTAQDPLISLSYINGTYLPSVLADADEAIEVVTEEKYEAALDYLVQVVGNLTPSTSGSDLAGYEYEDAFSEMRLKKGDTISGMTGTSVLLLAGDATVTFSTGAVIDVTEGKTVSSGASLAANTRYLGGEDAKPVFTIRSDTAVISVDGFYQLEESNETDYNMLADALKQMGLFKGKDLSIGSGYALEDKANRIEGLIMFLRLLGQEDEALASKASHPFQDVPDQFEGYVAYAYEKGYTNGVSSVNFGTYQEISAEEYVTFLLRALGYGERDYTWETSISDAQKLGILTAGEEQMLHSNPFYRAQMVYISYYGLNAKIKAENGTLLDALGAAGAVDVANAKTIMSNVTSIRIS